MTDVPDQPSTRPVTFDLVGYNVAIPMSLGLTLDPKGPRDPDIGFVSQAQRLFDGHGLALEVCVTPDGQQVLDSDDMLTFTQIRSGEREYMTVDQGMPPNYYQLGYLDGDALIWLNFSATDTVDPTAAQAIADQIEVTKHA